LAHSSCKGYAGDLNSSVNYPYGIERPLNGPFI